MSVPPNSGILPDVELPPWSSGNSVIFLKVLREALESDYVSQWLHRWIDLIFGFRQVDYPKMVVKNCVQQRGREAEEAANLFHPVTYLTTYVRDHKIDANALQIDDAILTQVRPVCKMSLLKCSQVREYGQAPFQLFTHPHPMRLTRQELKFISNEQIEAPDPECIKSILEFPRSNCHWSSLKTIIDCGLSSLSSDSNHDNNNNKLIPNVLRSKVKEKRRTEEAEDQQKNTKFHDLKKNQPLARFKTSILQQIPLRSNDDKVTAFTYHRESDAFVLGTRFGTVNKTSIADASLSIPLTSCPITSLAFSSSNSLICGNHNGEMIHIKFKSENDTQQHLIDTIDYMKSSPHHDSLQVAASASNCDWILTSSIDNVMGLWEATPSGLRQLSVVENQNITTASLHGNLGMTGTSNGAVNFWDFRISQCAPIWESKPLVHTHNSSSIIDCNASSLDSQRTFTLGLLIETGRPRRLKPINSDDMEDHHTFRSDVYNSLKNSASLSRMPSFVTTTQRLDGLLFDIRMIDSAASTTTTGLVNMQSSVIGKHSWISSLTHSSKNSTITDIATDGYRWAIVVGVTETTALSPPLSENFQRKVKKNVFVSVADLSCGMRSIEMCRWPLQLGTFNSKLKDDSLDHNVMTTRIGTSDAWHLTDGGEIQNRFSILNADGQIETVR